MADPARGFPQEVPAVVYFRLWLPGDGFPPQWELMQINAHLAI